MTGLFQRFGLPHLLQNQPKTFTSVQEESFFIWWFVCGYELKCSLNQSLSQVE